MSDSERFIDALTRRDLAAIRGCPKADLHTHGHLSANRAYVKAQTGHDIAPLKAPLTSMSEMHQWVGANVRPFFEGAAARLMGFEAAFVQARHDGLTRLEMGDAVWAITC